MPVISTLGAASSRGFGQFSQQARGNYIEDFFSTYLYTGNGNTQFVPTNIPTAATSAWATYTISDASGPAKSFGASGQSGTGSSGIVTDASGNFYVLSNLRTGSSDYISIAKYSSAGSLTWEKKATGTIFGGGVNVDSSGNVYVCGSFFSASPTDYRIQVLKFNSSGTLQWQRGVLEGNSNGYGVCVDSSGNVISLGSSRDSVPNTYWLITKRNSSGTISWNRKIKETESTPFSIAVDSGDNIIAVGRCINTSTSIPYATIAKIDTNGTSQWIRSLQETNGSTAYGVIVDSSDNICITAGCTSTTGTISYALTAKYNSSGVLQWARRLDNNTSTSAPMAGTFICRDSLDNLYISGFYGASSSVQTFVAKYNSSGTLQWQSAIIRSGTTGQVFPGGISIDLSGNLYVSCTLADAAGNSTGSTIVKIKDDGSSNGTALVNVVAASFNSSTSAATSATPSASVTTPTVTNTTNAATIADGTATTASYSQSGVISEGGLVWIKGRSGATDHALYDTARGATFDLVSNSSAVQTTQSTGLTAFSASGFSLGSLAKLNTSSAIYAAWTFRKAPKFFDIVTYAGNGVAGRQIPHNLGSVPGMIIVKGVSVASDWTVYHASLGNTKYIELNSVSGQVTTDSRWNDTSPTSTSFTLGNSGQVNTNGATYVAYLFAHDAGGFGDDGSQNVVSCGSYTGNGSATGPSITLGYEPQFLLIKNTTNNANWNLFDNLRGIPTGAADPYLFANTTAVEATTNGDLLDLTSTGFAIKSTNTQVNTLNSVYIYMAIRRGPMKTPTSGTSVFMPTVYTGTNVDNRLVNTTIAPDMVWVRQRNSTTVAGMVVGDRMRGQPYLLTGSGDSQSSLADAFDQQIVSGTEYGTAFSSMNGFWCGNNTTTQLNANTTSNNHVAEAFKRAPGFFDVVTYTGTAVARTVSHNLGVAPELMFTKRSTSASWAVYPNSKDHYMFLNSELAQDTAAWWQNTAPTSSVFYLSNSANVNASGGEYIAYLFASCPGVSKVGIYNGTGTTLQIDCGFTSGARFVLIKRTDAGGTGSNWFVWDSARGIVAGNDPYIGLNLTTAEVTNTDYVDAYSAGFELTGPIFGTNEATATTWTSRASQFSTTTIRGVTYGNGLFVAVGDSGKLSTSTNGFSWTSRTSGFGTTGIAAAAYGNGLYVIVGSSGSLATSTDGITWTTRTSGFGTSEIYGVTYGNGLFVAVGAAGKLTTSTDGITWTSQTSGFGTSDIYAVTYGNGLFVAAGQSGILTTSTDGVTWTSQTSGFSTSNIYGAAYGNGLFLIGGQSAKLSTSTDGVTWTSRTSAFSAGVDVRSITYGAGVYVAVGGSGNLTTSTDGTTWTSRTSGFGVSVIFGVTSGNDTLVAVGQSGVLTTSGKSNYLYLAIA